MATANRSCANISPLASVDTTGRINQKDTGVADSAFAIWRKLSQQPVCTFLEGVRWRCWLSFRQMAKVELARTHPDGVPQAEWRRWLPGFAYHREIKGAGENVCERGLDALNSLPLGRIWRITRWEEKRHNMIITRLDEQVLRIIKKGEYYIPRLLQSRKVTIDFRAYMKTLSFSINYYSMGAVRISLR
jgi:hypothetical protein